MRQYNYTVSPTLSNAVIKDSMLSALFTYGYLARLPVAVRYADPKWFHWRPHTHRFKVAQRPQLQALVFTALCAMHRACARLPRDVRNHVLVLAFAEDQLLRIE